MKFLSSVLFGIYCFSNYVTLIAEKSPFSGNKILYFLLIIRAVLNIIYFSLKDLKENQFLSTLLITCKRSWVVADGIMNT